MNFLPLIDAIRHASGPEQFWRAQVMLLDAHRITEARIRKRKTSQAHIKSEKLKYTRSPGRTVHRIQRFDQLIKAFEDSEYGHWGVRNALRYLGDALAHRLLEEHQINALSHGSDNGFLFDKQGIEFEISCAQLAADKGYYVILNDLTHCLTLADLLAVGPGGLRLIECKMAAGKKSSLPRLKRQSERASLVLELLTKERLEAPPQKKEELGLQLLPNFYAEVAHPPEKYLLPEFLEACRLGPSGTRVVVPEPGLAYIAYREGSFSDKIIDQLPWMEKEARLLVGTLDERIWGKAPHAPPIVDLDVPASLLQELLAYRIRFAVIINLGIVEAELKARGVSVGPLCETDSGLWWSIPPREPWTELKISSRRLDGVAFGLLSLQSALDRMAGMVRTPFPVPT